MKRVKTVLSVAQNSIPLLLALIISLAIVGMFFVSGEAETQSEICGDTNNDLMVNIGDVVYLVSYIFKGGPPPEPLCGGDVNGDGDINLGDGVYLVAWIFKGGPAPVCMPGGGVTEVSGCKLFLKDAGADTIPPNLSCVEYNYDGEGFLSLIHYNAGFNCCPGEISVDVSIEGNIIILTEAEEMAACPRTRPVHNPGN